MESASQSRQADKAKPLISIKDIAKEAGVSICTVSLVLNNKDRNRVSKAVAQRVRETAQSMGYKPNSVARTLRTSRSYALGFITDEIAAHALDRLDIDPLGLDAIDRRMLTTIIRNYGGGPVGLDTLAAAINEESVTLEDVYEPYLMQIGFLTRTPRGRCVTHLAYEHLGIPQPIGQMKDLEQLNLMDLNTNK